MPEPSPNDREVLIKIVNDLISLLDSIVAEGRGPQGEQVLAPDILEEFRNAWKELLEQLDASNWRGRIMDTDPNRLKWAGLYGEQLKLKTGVIERFRSRYLDGLGLKWLKKLLDAFDRVLDSIIAATGFDEALKEFKDILSDNVEVD